MSEIANDTELFLELTEDLDITPKCESANCERHGKGSHDADWTIRLDTCGDDIYWCSARFIEYQKLAITGHHLMCQKCGTGFQSIIWWAPVRS